MTLAVNIPDAGYHVYDAPLKAELLEYNRRLAQCVTSYKNQIDEFFAKRNCWDQIKKISNEYELIFTSLYKHPCVARVTPPSRSYFKLWEILKLFRDSIPWSLRSAHVCEGPGGFIECVMDWMARYHPSTPTEIHGLTLLSKDRVVPNWKLGKAKMGRFNVRLHAGVDGTGDVYNIANIDHFIQAIGGDGVCDLYTADGGFDVKVNFNQVESILERLLVSEVYIGLRACKIGGALVIKIFDTFTDVTMHLLWVVHSMFRSMNIVKPLTSRPANSERYIVATGFKGAETIGDAARLLDMRTYITNQGRIPLRPNTPTDFIAMLTSFNTTYAFKQADQIMKTLSYIEQIYVQKNKALLTSVLTKQYSLCKEWCIERDLEWNANPTLEEGTGVV